MSENSKLSYRRNHLKIVIIRDLFRSCEFVLINFNNITEFEKNLYKNIIKNYILILLQYNSSYKDLIKKDVNFSNPNKINDIIERCRCNFGNYDKYPNKSEETKIIQKWFDSLIDEVLKKDINGNK